MSNKQDKMEIQRLLYERLNSIDMHRRAIVAELYKLDGIDDEGARNLLAMQSMLSDMTKIVSRSQSSKTPAKTNMRKRRLQLTEPKTKLRKTCPFTR
jgi:hypothetical protein